MMQEGNTYKIIDPASCDLLGVVDANETVKIVRVEEVDSSNKKGYFTKGGFLYYIDDFDYRSGFVELVEGRS